MDKTECERERQRGDREKETGKERKRESGQRRDKFDKKLNE